VRVLWRVQRAVSGNSDDPSGVSWQREVDGLLRVLLTARNESVMRARRHVVELRNALRSVERHLDHESTGDISDDTQQQGGAAVIMREPMSQQLQQQQQQQV